MDKAGGAFLDAECAAVGRLAAGSDRLRYTAVTPGAARRPMCVAAVGLGSARHLAEHLARPVFPQFRHLSRDALAVRRYPRIAVNHGFILHQNSAPKKPNWFKALILVHISRLMHFLGGRRALRC